MRKKLKRLGAGFLSAVLIAQTISPLGEVRAAELAEEEQQAAQLAAMSDQYPEGAFAFENGQLEVKEGNTAELVIVRKGNTDHEAKVSIRAVDISAQYGLDYVMTVQKGAFITKTLEADPDSRPLMESYDALEEAANAAKDAEEEEASEAVPSEVDAADDKADDREGAAAESPDAETSDAETSETEKTEPDEPETDDSEKKEPETVTVKTELDPNAEAGESILDKEAESSKKIRTPDGKSSLQTARENFVGKESERVDWREVNREDTQYEQMAEMTQQGQESMETFAANINGVKYDFTFKPGEYKKVIQLETLDDKISESAEQVMFMLFGAEEAGLGDVTTAYLNIVDNDKVVKSVFEALDSDIYVNRGEEYVEIPVRRTKGETRFATVVASTADGTAKKVSDYGETTQELTFVQGSTEKTLRIPLNQASTSEGEKTFSVKLKAAGGSVAKGKETVRVHIVEAGTAKMRMAKAAVNKERISLDYSKSVTAKNGAWADIVVKGKDFSESVLPAKKLDLSTADSVRVYFDSNTGETSWETGSGCNKKSHNSKARKIKLKVGSASQEKTYDSYTTNSYLEVKISKDDDKVTDGSVTLSATGTDGNTTAGLKMTRIEIHYPGYTFKINNPTDGTTAKTNPYSIYEEKQYYLDSSKEYTNGPTLILGTMNIMDDDSSLDRQTYYQPSAVNLKAVLKTDTVNSAGVAVNSENTECLGIVIKNNEKETDVIPLNKVTFDKAFIKTYKDYLSAGNVFSIYPVFKPKASSVYLAQIEGDTYRWVRQNGRILKCSTLDTVWAEAIVTDSKKAVKEIAAAPITVDNKPVQMTQSYVDRMTATIQSGNEPAYMDTITESLGSANMVQRAVRLEPSSDDYEKPVNGNPGRVCLTPVVPLYVYCSTATYTVQVEAYRKGQNVELTPEGYLGNVIYQNGEESKTGDPGRKLLIDHLKLNQNIRLTGVTMGNYRVRWKEISGDLDGDQELDRTENKKLGNYIPMKPVSGNVLSKKIGRENTILMYDFAPINPDVSEKLYGDVKIRKKEIFTGKIEQSKPGELPAVQGANIFVDGEADITDEDGSYFLEKQGWSQMDYYNVDILYDGVTYSTISVPGYPEEIVLEADKPIYVKAGTEKAFMMQDNGTWKSVNVDALSNGDHNYMLEMCAGSTESAVKPSKAILTFYTKEGVKVDEKEVEQTPSTVTNADGTTDTVEDTGVFQFKFNPKKSGLLPGTTMTVRFEDQYGNQYLEQPTGIRLAKALGMTSFVNSLSFTANAGSLVGTIDSIFDLGWSGNLDHSEHVTEETLKHTYIDASGGNEAETTVEQKIKTISFGFNINEDRLASNDLKAPLWGIEKDAQKIASADEKVAEQKHKLKKMKEDDRNSKEDLDKQREKIAEAKKASDTAREKYDKAGYEKADKKKLKVNMAFNASVNLDFCLAIHLYRDIDTDEWYFYDMVMSAEFAAGVKLRFVFKTPIGLDVVLQVSLGLSEGEEKKEEDKKADIGPSKAMMTVAWRQGQKYWLKEADIPGEEVAKIDLFDHDMNDADRQFDYNGVLRIVPYISLEGEVGFDLISTTVGGNVGAYFDLYFYSDPKQEDIKTLKITGEIFVKILGFRKPWNLGTSEIDMTKSAKARSAELYRALAGDVSLYDSASSMKPDDRSYLANKTDWNGGTAKKARAAQAFNEQILKKGAYQYPDVQFADLGNGSVLAVFLDAVPGRNAVNDTAVYYSIYQNQTWSRPVILEDDGTIDDAPTISDLGDKGVMVAWSTADKVFSDNANVIDVLSSRNIHTALFDKKNMTFGKVQEATKTTEEDITGDVQPGISYYKADNGEERMLMYYSKNEYLNADDGSSNDALLGDALNPYSVMAYMYYDFDNNCWRKTYTEKEKEAILSGGAVTEAEFADYEKNWYGQGFLTMAPVVNVEETLTEAGYWAEEPKITETDGNIWPVVVDSSVITYNGLALFASVLDQDADLTTKSDREVFLQIYDYKDDTFTHPIQITSGNETVSKVQFARANGSTYLSWLADSRIQVFNLSYVIKNGGYAKAATKAGEPYYYLVKKDNGNYLAPHTIAAFEDTKEAMLDGNPNAGAAISDFDIQSNGKELYVLWTENGMTYKTDATDEEPANYIPENQIYGSRLDTTDGQWGGRSQITTEQGAHYGQLDFAVCEDGSLMIMAQKSGIEQTEVDGLTYNRENEDDSALVSLNVNPTSDAVLTALEMETPSEENSVFGTVRYANKGFEDAKDLSLVVTDADGKELLNEKIDNLPGGLENENIFEYRLKKAADGKSDWGVTAELRKGSQVISTLKKSGTLEASAEILDFKVSQNQSRNEADVEVTVGNTASITSKAEKVQVTAGKDKKCLAELEVPELAPGETKTLKTTITFDNSMFITGTDEDGNHTESLEVQAVCQKNNQVQSIERKTPKDVWKNFQKMTKSGFAEKGKIAVKTGERKAAEVTVEGPELKYDEFTSWENYGIQVRWATKDPSIAEVDERGNVTGVKEGTTKLYAAVMPKDYIVQFDGNNLKGADANGYGVSSWLTLTSDVIKIYEKTVVVEKGKTDGSTTPDDGKDTGKDGTDDKTDQVDSGDHANILLWMLLIAMSGGACVIVLVKRRKRY